MTLSFQGKRIRPDILIFQKGDGGYVKCLKDTGAVHYLIEVKRPESFKKDCLLDEEDEEVKYSSSRNVNYSKDKQHQPLNVSLT